MRGRGGWWWAWVGVFVVSAVVMYLLTGTPHIRHSSAINAAFDARWMIAGTRLVVVAAAAYLLASIAVRVRRGQWVRSAASVETDMPTQDLVDDQEDLQERLREAQRVIADLEGQVAQFRSMIQQLTAATVDTPGGSTAGDPDEGLEDASGTESGRD
jgi:type VI protein secretion system component VasK